MSNVISADSTAAKHYLHSGFSDTITSSYASPDGSPRGITWDGTNVISADSSVFKHYLHSGFSASIISSYTSPGSVPRGITWDGTNVISADSGSGDKHYLHSGFSGTITSSYTGPSTDPQGITWDGTNVISDDDPTRKHYLHSGFSASIISSYTSPGTGPRGITWDGTNVISTDSIADRHYLHSGFSDTITSSYTSPSGSPSGITWDGRYSTVAPTVTTQAVTDIATTTATGNGNITDTGGENADKRGVVWSTSSRGDPGDVSPAASAYESVNEETGSFGTGAFTRSITGLSPGTPYYVRAYAHNSEGYSYGGEVSFTTLAARVATAIYY